MVRAADLAHSERAMATRRGSSALKPGFAWRTVRMASSADWPRVTGVCRAAAVPVREDAAVRPPNKDFGAEQMTAAHAPEALEPACVTIFLKASEAMGSRSSLRASRLSSSPAFLPWRSQGIRPPSRS